MPASPPAPQVRYVPAAPKVIPRSRRIARVILVFVWFLILLIPGFFFLMVANGEFSIPLGDAPEQTLRVWLVSEIRERGFAVSTGTVAMRADTELCVQTSLRYLLWQGTPDPADYCECFVRESVSSEWSYSTGWQGNCSQPPNPEEGTE